MELLITHESALQYWRLHGKSHRNLLRRQHQGVPPAIPPTDLALHQTKSLGLALPMEISVSKPSGRRTTHSIRSHVLSKTLPGSCFVKLTEEVYVSSPELCFLQMAAKLPLVKLIELGFELCGSYSLPGHSTPSSEDKGDDLKTNTDNLIIRPPLTSSKRLSVLLARKELVPGSIQARRALRHITDNSASPMETKLTMLLSLPQKLGGYGLPMPILNARINPAKSAKKSTDKTHFSCDLFWPTANLAVEYDSDTHHTGPERIASDSKRRNTLSSIGILVITVTNRQVRSRTEFEKTTRLIATNMGHRLQLRNKDFVSKQNSLRAQLL